MRKIAVGACRRDGGRNVRVDLYAEIRPYCCCSAKNAPMHLSQLTRSYLRTPFHLFPRKDPDLSNSPHLYAVDSHVMKVEVNAKLDHSLDHTCRQGVCNRLYSDLAVADSLAYTMRPCNDRNEAVSLEEVVGMVGIVNTAVALKVLGHNQSSNDPSCAKVYRDHHMAPADMKADGGRA